jgi:hypothetical protein
MIRSPDSAARLVAWLEKMEGDLFLLLVDAIGSLRMVEELVPALKEALRRGRLVPFIGPDLPEALTGLPPSAQLAEEFAKRAGSSAGQALSSVASARIGSGGGRNELIRYLMDSLGDTVKLPPTNLYQFLGQIKASFWLQANYDLHLSKIVGARRIYSGQDSLYFGNDPKVVVHLFGGVDRPSYDMLLIPEDYSKLRSKEDDRTQLLTFLRQRLVGAVVLMLGFDPHNGDFPLLVESILNGHLAGVEVCPIFVWPQLIGEMPKWGNGAMHPVCSPPDEIIRLLVAEDRG